MAGPKSSQKLTSEAVNFSSDIHVALLESVNSNRNILIRLYKHVDPEMEGSKRAFRSWQLLTRNSDNHVVALNAVHHMDKALIISDEPGFSTILASGALPKAEKNAQSDTDPTLGRIGHNYGYVEL